MIILRNSIIAFLELKGVQPHFCPWEKWEKSIWKETEKYSFPPLSIYFFPILSPGEKWEKTHFPMGKNGVGPPPVHSPPFPPPRNLTIVKFYEIGNNDPKKWHFLLPIYIEHIVRGKSDLNGKIYATSRFFHQCGPNGAL